MALYNSTEIELSMLLVLSASIPSFLKMDVFCFSLLHLLTSMDLPLSSGNWKIRSSYFNGRRLIVLHKTEICAAV